jgi:hypothetical protein
MTKRPLLDRHREWLLEEIGAWRQRELVSAEQAAGILDLYETPHDLADRRRSHAVFVLMSAAALMCGLAVLLLVGYNWEELPRTAKLVMIFGVILGTHAGAFYLRYQQKSPAFSEAVFFLGCLLYGVGIWLVAQVFHLEGHYPDAVWYWAIGVLPFALCLDTLLLHGLLVALLALWAGMEVLGFSHLGGWFFGRWGLLPNGAYTLPLLAAPGLIWAYRKDSPTTVALYAALLAWWAVLQPFAWHRWDDPFFIVAVIGSVAALLIIAGQSHRERSPFALPYRVFGGLLAAGTLIPLSYYDFHEELARESSRLEVLWTGPARILATLALPAVAMAFAVLLHAVRQRRSNCVQPLSLEWPDLLRRLWFPVVLMVVMTFSSLAGGAQQFRSDPILGYTPLGVPELVGAILGNVGMIACACWFLQVGFREDSGVFFAAGVLYFLLWAVLRYIDLFGDFGGMLGASAMFFLCAGALFGVALYWRRRQEVRDV